MPPDKKFDLAIKGYRLFAQIHRFWFACVAKDKYPSILVNFMSQKLFSIFIIISYHYLNTSMYKYIFYRKRQKFIYYLN